MVLGVRRHTQENLAHISGGKYRQPTGITPIRLKSTSRKKAAPVRNATRTAAISYVKFSKLKSVQRNLRLERELDYTKYMLRKAQDRLRKRKMKENKMLNRMLKQRLGLDEDLLITVFRDSQKKLITKKKWITPGLTKRPIGRQMTSRETDKVPDWLTSCMKPKKTNASHKLQQARVGEHGQFPEGLELIQIDDEPDSSAPSKEPEPEIPASKPVRNLPPLVSRFPIDIPSTTPQTEQGHWVHGVPHMATTLQTQQVRSAIPATTLQTQQVRSAIPATTLQTQQVRSAIPATTLQTQQVRWVHGVPHMATTLQTQQGRCAIPATTLQTQQVRWVHGVPHMATTLQTQQVRSAISVTTLQTQQGPRVHGVPDIYVARPVLEDASNQIAFPLDSQMFIKCSVTPKGIYLNVML